MKVVDTQTAVEQVKKRFCLTFYSEALTKFREEYYDGYQLKLVHMPEIKFDSKNNVYTILCEQGTTNHSFKIDSSLVGLIANYLGNPNAYFGFKFNDLGIINDCVVEVF